MSSKVLDLQQVVRNWAWRVFDDTATSKEKKLRKKQKKSDPNNTGVGGYIGLQIDWGEVHFHDESKWSPISDVEFGGTASGTAPADHGTSPERSTPGASLLFQTTYTNNTDEPQEYTITTTKTTRSSFTTEIENSFTRGFEMGVTLKAPGEVFEANAGYSREYSLTNTDGQTFEEELTWGVDSLIKVPKKHRADASLVVSEKKQEGNFTIKSEIRGMVFVTFTNIRDNNSLLKATGDEICEIVKKHKERENRKGNEMDFVQFEDDKLIVTTKGRCNFRYGVKQEVKVNETPLSKS